MRKTIVIKFGTSTLTNGGQSLSRPYMLELVKQIAELHKRHRVIVVTSGAAAAGRDYLGHPKLPKTLAYKQMLAAVGQSQLIRTWESLFDIYGIHIGQILLTRADIDDRERFLNARDTLNALLEQKIIPVINENDTVATEEFKVGDNDNLSALVAILAQADQLYLLTDQQGLFTADPRKVPNAELLSVVEKITPEIRLIAGDSSTGLGTGGMSTKIIAADIATRSGVETIIASGSQKNVLLDLAGGKAVGSRFLVQAGRLEGRKQWLFAAPQIGSLVVDEGAETALLRHKSLLPVGIVEIRGIFSRGEVVKIFNRKNQAFALGLARYGSDALVRIKGKKSTEIESLLGYEFGPVAVHSDEMVVY